MTENGDRNVDDNNSDARQHFFKMFILTFSSKKEKKASLEQLFSIMQENSVSEMWGTLGNKMDMMVEELNVFMEQSGELNLLEDLFKSLYKKIETIKDEKDKLADSDIVSVGFFTKIPKEDKIKEYENQINVLSEKKNAIEGLVNLLSYNLTKEGIPFAKQQKKTRFNKFIKEFAKKQIKAIQNSLNFWDCVVKDLNEEDEMIKED